MPTKFDAFESSLNTLNRNLANLNSKQSFKRIFLSGIITGLGSAVGATLIVAILLYLLSKVELVPIVGTWLSEVITEIISKLPNYNGAFPLD